MTGPTQDGSPRFKPAPGHQAAAVEGMLQGLSSLHRKVIVSENA